MFLIQDTIHPKPVKVTGTFLFVQVVAQGSFILNLTCLERYITISDYMTRLQDLDYVFQSIQTRLQYLVYLVAYIGTNSTGKEEIINLFTRLLSGGCGLSIIYYTADNAAKLMNDKLSKKC